MGKDTSAVSSGFTICVASTNPVKVAAAEEGFRTPSWVKLVGKNLTFKQTSVDSNVSEVPTSIEEGIIGVENRLRAAMQQPAASDLFFAVEGIVVLKESHLPFVVPIIGVSFSELDETSIAFGTAVTIPDPYANNLLKSKFHKSRNREDLLEVFREDPNFDEEKQSTVGLNGLFTKQHCRHYCIVEALEYLGLQAIAANKIEKPFASIRPFETTDFNLNTPPWQNVLTSPQIDKASNSHYALHMVTGQRQTSPSFAAV